MLAAIYGASEVALGLRKRARAGSAKSADRGSLRLLWVVILGSLTAAFWADMALPQGQMAGVLPPARAAGVVIFLGGLVLRWYAISYLGRFFTVDVAIARDHRLIDGGPYRYVRHPSYTGALFAFLGVGLCIGNWVSLAVVALPIALVFLWRIHVEEAALLQGLGESYRQYMGRTKRLIPGLY